MGKKGRKTRWRALTITDEQSDSEESNTTTSGPNQITKGHIYNNHHQHKTYHSKFPYSSHSTPTRRQQQQQYDHKSTRSSSTASENKITFNEDEYTRITTPRQDVLFKKGYLNKPRNYQTQTSTGNSTTSTGNSTGNGTPDHQSADGTEGTDLEYESQFVYPNGFVDPNGIYYISGYEPYPVVVYNAPPFCYPEYQNVKTKRYSTGSLTESMSPNNEETSQETNQNGVEAAAGNVAEYNPVYGVVYHSDYYYSNVCPATEVDGQYTPETRRLKKRRRRKVSRTRTQHDGNTSELTDECESSDDESSQERREVSTHKQQPPITECKKSGEVINDKNETIVKNDIKTTDETITKDAQSLLLESLMKNEVVNTICDMKDDSQSSLVDNNQIPDGVHNKKSDVDVNCDTAKKSEVNETSISNGVVTVQPVDGGNVETKFNLKADAQEFVPRAYRQVEQIPVEFINFPPNIVPLPLLTPTYNPAYIPPITPIPINYIQQQDPKIYPNYFIPNCVTKDNERNETIKEELKLETTNEIQTTPENDNKTLPTPNETLPRTQQKWIKTDIDIEKIVLKLEEAAKEQQLNENKKKHFNNRKPPLSKMRVGKLINNQRDQKCYQKTIVNNKSSDNCSKQKTNAVYAEMLKRCPRYEKHAQNIKKETPSSVNNKMTTPISTPTTTPKHTPKSQWISVSNRKKRKNNKIVNEETNEEEIINETDQHLFESYDVDLLVDVVPPTKESSTNEIKVVEEFNEVSLTEEIVNKPSEVIINVETNDVQIEPTAPSIDVIIDLTIPTTEEKKIQSGRRKGKKISKTQSRRVIITDVNLPVCTEEPKISETIKEQKKTAIEVEVITDEIKTDEKKQKKKKKKVLIKTSASSSTTTLNNLDDSYDFLLDTSVLSDAFEKTNIEVSQELDRMIQKGIYNSLEEKIKSLNIVSNNDGFFRSVSVSVPKVSSAPPSGQIKANDFASLTLLKKPNLTTETDILNIDFSQIKLPDLEEPQPSTSKSGNFLEEVDKDDSNRLYPITKAVKEWMSKTRENTPEIEILKSPSTIYKEFCTGTIDSDVEETSDESCQKNFDVNPPLAAAIVANETSERVDDVTTNDDDITLFTRHEPDLLDCWDDLTYMEEIPKATSAEIACCNGHVEQGEDVLEVYDSKYGKNEDYMKIRSEVEEKKRNMNLPKHGNLPYRAICCSLM